MSDPQTRPLGFLLYDVARLLRRRFDGRAQAFGLTRAQWHVLVVLKRQEGLNQSALADLMDMEPITLSRHIDRLESAGWVERRPDPNDRRARRLYLGERVTPLLEDMRKLGSEVFGAALEGISEAEAAQLVDILDRMRSNLAGKGEGAAEGKTFKETAA